MTGIRVAADIPEYFRELYGSPSQIEAAIDADKDYIISQGYDVTLYYFDERDEQGSLDHMEKLMRSNDFDGIMVGTGLRMVPPMTGLFEKVMNVIRRASHRSLLMFNDAPGGNWNALKRNGVGSTVVL